MESCTHTTTTLEIFLESICYKSSNSSINILNNKAVKFVHGDIEGDVYLENLTKWVKESSEKIKVGESEIPSHLSQGDLYCE